MQLDSGLKVERMDLEGKEDLVDQLEEVIEVQGMAVIRDRDCLLYFRLDGPG